MEPAGSMPIHLNVQPPAWDDFSSGEDSDQEDDERPLTREELKRKTLRGPSTGGGGGCACTSAAGAGGGGGSKPKDGKVRGRRVAPRQPVWYNFLLHNRWFAVDSSLDLSLGFQ